jgi:hypothetical protein
MSEDNQLAAPARLRALFPKPGPSEIVFTSIANTQEAILKPTHSEAAVSCVLCKFRVPATLRITAWSPVVCVAQIDLQALSGALDPALPLSQALPRCHVRGNYACSCPTAHSAERWCLPDPCQCVRGTIARGRVNMHADRAHRGCSQSALVATRLLPHASAPLVDRASTQGWTHWGRVPLACRRACACCILCEVIIRHVALINRHDEAGASDCRRRRRWRLYRFRLLRLELAPALLLQQLLVREIVHSQTAAGRVLGAVSTRLSRTRRDVDEGLRPAWRASGGALVEFVPRKRLRIGIHARAAIVAAKYW